ncbi:MAG: hypothetical protein J6S67_05960 [Methanobrevibacter sp.]|nr:hypothetical protein [Methanobrevibacter sp.]
MLKLDLILFGGRGANFKLKKDTEAKNTNNAKIVIPAGTQFKNVIVIAGDDRKRKIDEVDGLVKNYGGKKKNWSKRVASATINGKKAEVHYYQNKKDKIGRVKYKIKRWLK